MSEQIPTKMATSVVTDVFSYALCRWTLMKALVGILLLLMSAAGKQRSCLGLKPFLLTAVI
jgi:hypothetical protein